MKNECKWNRDSGISADRIHGKEDGKKCGIRNGGIHGSGGRKGGAGQSSRPGRESLRDGRPERPEGSEGCVDGCGERSKCEWPGNPGRRNDEPKNAVEFTKKSQSVTYPVFSVESKELLGYFTLALKPLSVRGETVSKTTKRKLLRISELDEKSDTYTMSAYLIAQLGKNYTNDANEKITGKELVELAWTVIEESYELVQLLRLL